MGNEKCFPLFLAPLSIESTHASVCVDVTLSESTLSKPYSAIADSTRQVRAGPEPSQVGLLTRRTTHPWKVSGGVEKESLFQPLWSHFSLAGT